MRLKRRRPPVMYRSKPRVKPKVKRIKRRRKPLLLTTDTIAESAPEQEDAFKTS